MRVVLDTNVYISLLFSRQSVVTKLLLALANHDLLVSASLIQEIRDVLARPKFTKVVPVPVREGILATVQTGIMVSVSTVVTDCCDVKDNHVLALALDGQAHLAVTGDTDLLVLHPWRGIPVVSPAVALQHLT